MLTKYQLTNIPEGGVFHILPGRRRVRIVKEMSDEQADELISLGIAQYFLPINDNTNGEEQNSSSEGTSSAGDQPGSSTIADQSGASDQPGNEIQYAGDESYTPLVIGTDGNEPSNSGQSGNGNDSAGTAKRNSARRKKI